MTPTPSSTTAPQMSAPRYHRILLTGAAGRLGSQLRRALAPLATHLRLADIQPLADVQAHEECVVFDLADADACMAATREVDAIVHFGGLALEAPWHDILNANIRGSYHIYEGARRHGVKRVVYASSVHAIGYHTLDAHIGTDAPVRPDSLYGVSKCFVEALASLYWDKFGVESVCLRIFSSFPEPADRRMLWSYLSFADCARLVTAALTAPHTGHTVSFGLSDNRVKAVDNTRAAHLGYVAQDSAEPFRAQVEGKHPAPDPKAMSTRCVGGWFVDLPHPDDAAAPAGA